MPPLLKIVRKGFQGVQLAGVSLLSLIVLEIACGFIIHFHNRRGRTLSSNSAQAYQNAKWARQLSTENSLIHVRWEPYSYWRVAPFDGEFLNVDARGIRKTYNVNKPDLQTVRIFMFGGSTLWGLGVRDAHTIPSVVSGQLAGKVNLNVNITNFGQLGYVNTQELITLLRELQKGNKPDIVVFYDGLNDVFSAYQQSTPGITQNEIDRAKEFNILSEVRWPGLCKEFVLGYLHNSFTTRVIRHLFKIPGPWQDPRLRLVYHKTDRLSAETAKVYILNVKTILQMARANGFSALFYWQPIGFTKKYPTPFERKNFDLIAPIRNFALNTYAEVKASKALARTPEFHDISRLLDYRKEQLYIDPNHLSELGNEIVGKRMSIDLLKILKNRFPPGVATSDDFLFKNKNRTVSRLKP